MRSRWLALLVGLLLLSPVGLLAQGKGKGRGKAAAKAGGNEVAVEAIENRQDKGKHKGKIASTTPHGKAHQLHAKKKGATEGKKKGQQGTTPGKGPGA